MYIYIYTIRRPEGQINAFLWAFKPAVCLLGTPNPASNRHPKAGSMASYGRSSLPVASL